MCGRYAFYAAPHKLKDLFGVDHLPNFPPRYNAAPQQHMPVIIKHKAGMARWGFVPSWGDIDDAASAAKMINARSETVAEKPSFRESWQAGRRCLIPVNGFYEWQKQAGGQKQPYYIFDPAQECLAFAGIWSKKDGVVTFSVLTKKADGDIVKLHPRAPVMISPRDIKTWFYGGADEVSGLIAKSTARKLSYHPVSDKVGRVANDSEELIEEVKIFQQAALAI